MGSDHVKGSPNAARKCFEFGHRNNRGEPCGANVIKGTSGCWKHAGMSKAKAKARGAVVVEVMKWGLGDTTIDPGELLLRLVTQSAARVEFYSRLLGEAYEAAERLRKAQATPESDLLGAETARMDLERILNTGGVAALIGHTYAGTQTSGVIATGEKIRGLAQLEADERDRAANLAAKAVAAGLAERQVRLAERQGVMLLAVLQAVLSDPEMGASEAQRALLPVLLERHVAAIAGRTAA